MGFDSFMYNFEVFSKRFFISKLFSTIHAFFVNSEIYKYIWLNSFISSEKTVVQISHFLIFIPIWIALIWFLTSVSGLKFFLQVSHKWFFFWLLWKILMWSLKFSKCNISPPRLQFIVSLIPSWILLLRNNF